MVEIKICGRKQINFRWFYLRTSGLNYRSIEKHTGSVKNYVTVSTMRGLLLRSI